jgi:adenosylcobinamide-phosphate synthase
LTAHLTAIALAFFIDLAVGDPPRWPHPVKWVGKMISFFDRRWNRGKNRKLKGTAMAAAVIGIVWSASFFLVLLFYKIHPIAGILAEAILISTAIAQKSLGVAAREVDEPLRSGDLQKARKKLSYIVGRDTEQLPEAEIIRGTVETVAENTSDGITAPLFWAFVGGAPLALVYRATNTCDSMVGYKSDRYREFGWASAKLDDVLNWIPARITAFVMMCTMKPLKTSYRRAWSILLRDAKKHPSPNSGWGEAAVAALLGIRLGGVNVYNGKKSYRAEMGEGLESLQIHHIAQTVMIMKRTSRAFLLLLLIGGIVCELAFAWIQSQVYI